MQDDDDDFVNHHEQEDQDDTWALLRLTLTINQCLEEDVRIVMHRMRMTMIMIMMILIIMMSKRMISQY